MIDLETRSEIWREIDPKERQAILADHVAAFLVHVRYRAKMQREAAKIADRAASDKHPFPQGEPAQLPKLSYKRKVAQRIYAVLLEASDWMTRREISDQAKCNLGSTLDNNLDFLIKHEVIIQGPKRKSSSGPRSKTYALRRVPS